MKRFFPLLFVSSLAFAQPEVILAPVSHLYIPEGFDSNDSVEVVVAGNFSSPCFGRNKVEVHVNGSLVDIKITALSNEKSLAFGRACPDMIVPFKEVVSIGNLQGGNYNVRVNAGSSLQITDKLSVAEASSNSVDDHIYDAVDRLETKGNGDYVIHAWRYSSCFVLDKVQVVSNGKDTLSVLPEMKQVGDFCPMKGRLISYPVKLDFSSLKMKQPLVHIRTMDGKSVNTILNLED